ncbi:MAG: SMI1/KNR4 family protein [Planctomycetales bacterium]|nr:SMI1/KNR4 family protein [Planctomycetales bacterium]
MNEAIHQALLTAWKAKPESIRYRPASEDQLIRFESEFEHVPTEFRLFLSEFGGGAVGSEWVDGIEELFESHRKFRKEFGPPRGWTMTNVFVIGWDGVGNPFGIHQPSGKILVEDHNFGGIHTMAESFEEFLIEGILR